MSEFVPHTSSPEHIDSDDMPIVSGAKLRDQKIQTKRKRITFAIIIIFAIVLLFLNDNPWRVIIGIAGSLIILKIGTGVLGALARPVPEPPPPGELRKVKLVYKCTSCGTEIKMTLANDQVPEAPRHCLDDMELTTNPEDL